MIQTKFDNGILTATLDRPEQANSFTVDMFRQMRNGLQRASRTPEVRVIVIDAIGEDFSLGEDLPNIAQSDLDQRHPALTFMREFAFYPKPIIANVHGHAFGLGMALLLHCDLVVADPNSRFRLPFIQHELIPTFATTLLLPQRIGPQRSAALMLLGEEFTAEQAFQWGLINQVANAQQRTQQIETWCARLCQIPEKILRQTKQLLKHSMNTSEEVMCNEWHLFSEYMSTPEAQEH
ncbi:MAG: 2,3-dehydroadipyl-CoA hydratase [Candidatus Celerinatantimonas neptuna]|nr:MAG: 2,3-dehydroadipyl-CoA hydratase [Candidatus Celerinatantimonas neptuna]